MKNSFTVFLLTLLFLSLESYTQDAYILIDYMKVKSANETEYLSIEKEWKAIHEKKIAEGMIDGWQLWKKLFAGEEDSYQFITITWYSSFSQTNIKYPENFWADLMTEQELEELTKRTVSSRIMAKRELSHRVLVAENAIDANFLIINRMNVMHGMENEYVQMEREIWKPIHEESIRRGFGAHWSAWQSYPFNEGQPRFTTIDGFEEFGQIGTGYTALLRSVHPEMSWEEIDERGRNTRELVSTEIWELVDSLFPPED